MPKCLPCNYFIYYNIKYMCRIIQFSSVAQSCLTLCDHMDCSTPGFPVHHQPPELAQTHVHQVSDAIQPSHPLSFPSPAFNLSQHRDLFKWVSFSHQVAKVVELQLQHQSFQWIFTTDSLWIDWFDLVESLAHYCLLLKLTSQVLCFHIGNSACFCSCFSFKLLYAFKLRFGFLWSRLLFALKYVIIYTIICVEFLRI